MKSRYKINTEKFELPPDLNLTLAEIKTETDLVEFYDTFDWKIFNAGMQVYKINDKLFAEKIENKAPVELTGEIEENKSISKISGNRKILLKDKFTKNVVMYSVLNQDEKTVLKIHRETWVNSDRTKTILLQSESLRGYEKYHNSFCRFWDKIYSPVVSIALVKQLIPNAGEYSTKVNLALYPQQSAASAATEILKYLFGIMQLNEPGILEDTDVEFLHDFRVSVRRIRSAISEIKGVFSKELTGKLKFDLKNIGTQTNLLRDYDVYLEKENDFRQQLPQEYKTHLAPLFSYLKRKRKAELKKVVAFLNSPDYKLFKAKYDTILKGEQPGKYFSKKSASPVLEISNNRILKKISEIESLYTKIIQTQGVEGLHNLRIEFKKLRYLIEFFASLHEEEMIKTILSNLKKIQDVLGEYNDLSVQSDFLQNYVKNNTASRETIIAIGMLTGTMYNRQLALKQKFDTMFKNYFENELKVLRNCFS